MLDLTLRHEPLSGWSLTPAPYLFPDLPLFAALYGAGFHGPSVFDIYLDVFALLVMAFVVGVGVTLRRPNAAILVGALIALSAAGVEIEAFPRQRFKQSPKVACFAELVERHGLRHGAADYWDAKFLMELVDRPDLRVVSLDMQTLTPKDWIQNACWHLDEQGDVLPVEFVVIKDEQVTGGWPARWRERPARRESCPGLEVLIFEAPLSLEREVLESKGGIARCE